MSERKYIVSWHDIYDGPQENRFDKSFRAILHARTVAGSTGAEVKVIEVTEDSERVICERVLCEF